MTRSYPPGELSGLTDLPSWLTRIREIAAMPEAEALEATDTLLWSIQEITAAGPAGEQDWDESPACRLLCQWIAYSAKRLVDRRRAIDSWQAPRM